MLLAPLLLMLHSPLPTVPRSPELFELCFKGIRIPESHVNGREANICHVIEFFERPHDALPDDPAGHLVLSARLDLPLNRRECFPDPLLGDRTLLQRLPDSRFELRSLIRLATPVLLYNDEPRKLHTLRGREPMPAPLAFAPAPDRRAVLRHAGIHDFSFSALARGAAHAEQLF